MDQQRASGRARVVAKVDGTRALAAVTLSDGAEIGFAIGAMNAAGFEILVARPRTLTVALGRRRTAGVAKALRGVGFRVAD